MRNLSKGFSLVELMIVVAIIGILAAIAIPNFVSMQLKSKRSELPGNVDGIKTAELSYDAAFDGFISAAAAPTGTPNKTAVAWTTNTSFTSLGWGPDGNVRGQYSVASSTTDFTVTGKSDVDEVSRAGLRGLTTMLNKRTAVEAAEPLAVDIETDELAFFPLIYWPIVPGAPKPSPEALSRIDAYMKQGGTVLFDTRDAVLAPPGPGGEARSMGGRVVASIIWIVDFVECHANQLVLEVHRAQWARSGNGQNWTTD
jgi:prepilin-type N-terminal cleavage/methylation domain-containing protein